MGKTKKGKAIRPDRRTPQADRKLRIFLKRTQKAGDHHTWRRAKAVLGYIKGKSVISIAKELDVTRGSINRWLQWYNAEGIEGLKTRKPPGASQKLTEEQKQELIKTIEEGPQKAGFNSGVWTGPMIGEWIYHRFNVTYHNHHIPWVLHKLGFSVQRPRKRLARADEEAQEIWIRKKLPSIKKKRQPVVE